MANASATGTVRGENADPSMIDVLLEAVPCAVDSEQVWILDSESGKRVRRQALQMLSSLFRLSMIPFGKAGAG